MVRESSAVRVQEQYGSCKEKLAAIQCLNKRLLYDHIHCQHIPMVLCSNNAKSCYNHIVLIVAALSLCHLGANKAAVQSMIGTLNRMQYHVRSTHGDSKTSQGRWEWGIPITGIGQGNGASPQIWVAVSTPLFQILATEGFLAQIICAISAHQRSIVGFGFVDNTDLCVTTMDNQVTMVLHQMQDSLGMWAALLQATGGVLVPEKCFWYFIKSVWQQHKGQWGYADPDPRHQLQLPDNTRQSEEIPQLKVLEARHIFGVRLAPNGNDDTEYQYLLETSWQWQSTMATAKATHSAAEFGIQQMILLKLVYPLVTTTFTQQQCAEIMWLILAQGLPLAGFIWSFPRAIVHGPWQWGG